MEKNVQRVGIGFFSSAKENLSSVKGRVAQVNDVMSDKVLGEESPAASPFWFRPGFMQQQLQLGAVLERAALSLGSIDQKSAAGSTRITPDKQRRQSQGVVARCESKGCPGVSMTQPDKKR